MTKYNELQEQLEALPHISPHQVHQWVNLQETIDKSKDYLVMAVPEAQASVDQARRILEQKTWTLVFFGGTGVGKSTLINSLLGRNLLPTGAVTAVTGTIVYIEQAGEGEKESLTLNYWTRQEFAERVIRLCSLAEIPPFDITSSGERDQARYDIEGILEANRDAAKTERDEYLEILIDCLQTFENHQNMFEMDQPAPAVYDLADETALTHLREDGFKGSSQRQIRLVKSATFKIQPKEGVANLLMGGYLRIVDVPGLGAGMRLHEEITLEEMKKKDAMIVLVTDAGRQRVDEMKSLSAVHWVKDNRLFGLRGADLDDASGKIFVAVNGANVRQAYDRLNSGSQGEAEVKEVLRHIAPNYWERYNKRGKKGRPYFMVMTPSALYVQDPKGAPSEFKSETQRILSEFEDQLDLEANAKLTSKATKEALLELSEIPQLREALVGYIQNERVATQLKEAATRVRQAISGLRSHYENELAGRGVYPPFNLGWEALQQKRYENLLRRMQKELPRTFHSALLDLSNRTNTDGRFRSLLAPSLSSVKANVEETIRREIDDLLDSYGTEQWDDRDVTYDNLVWGTSGIELPIRRILFQVEMVMQQAVSRFMPSVADVVARELQQTMETHELKTRLTRAEYNQEYTYTLSSVPGEAFDLNGAYDAILEAVMQKFREVVEHATMYELMKPERSIQFKLDAAESLSLPTNERILDIALNGTQSVQAELAAAAEKAGISPNGAVPQPAVAAPASVPADDGIEINFLDTADDGGFAINLAEDAEGIAVQGIDLGETEHSYADRLDDVAVKSRELFGQIVDDLFGDDELLPRLRRLFWMEATKAEQSLNEEVIRPLLRNHDRAMTDDALREAMEVDLESVSDIEGMMRIWEGLNELEGEMMV
ncbi:MAG: dynamin family protein [Anaerolineae bacterium]